MGTPPDALFISYSQYSQYNKCPLAWKLKYIDKIKDDEPSIHSVFGNAMHAVIQHYLQVLFTETVKKSESLDFKSLLLTQIRDNYASEIAKYNRHFSTKEELTEIYMDGLATLQYLVKKRPEYFDKKGWELIGTELPLKVAPDPSRPTVFLISYLDIVFRNKNTGEIYIFDLKTSKRGWRDYEKKDALKVNQLILYKHFFSKQFNIPIDKINVEFYILKRKIDDDSMYPQRRVQKFKPTQGKIICAKALQSFHHFIDNCFDKNGQYKTDGFYNPTAGRNGYNCTFCPFKNREDICPSDKRLTC